MQINPGTDGALALGMAKIIIENGWADMDFIKNIRMATSSTHSMSSSSAFEKVASICGLDPAGIMEATRIFATNGPAAINQSASTMVHFINGFQAFRAILCLSALTGNSTSRAATSRIRRPICISPPVLNARARILHPQKPEGQRRIAEGKFPVWDLMCDEFQAMDLARQIIEGTPYPVKAIFGACMNVKMFPATDKLLEAIKQLDFFRRRRHVHEPDRQIRRYRSAVVLLAGAQRIQKPTRAAMRC